MGGELTPNQGNQVFCPLFGVVMEDVGTGDAACFLPFSVGQGPHPRIGKPYIAPRSAERRGVPDWFQQLK